LQDVPNEANGLDLQMEAAGMQKLLQRPKLLSNRIMLRPARPLTGKKPTPFQPLERK
jgi:hypothetical protein